MKKWLIGFLGFLWLAGGAFAGRITLLGAGATFPYPLYSKWFHVYYQKTGVRVNYQSIGSGGGIRQILARTVDFGATDAPMSDEELAKAPAKILHLPMAIGAVVIAYNLPGVPSGLRLTPEVLADIFLGKIRKWNDPRIVKLNPDLKLPALPIMVIHRSDGSGTTFNFTYYLSRVSPEWRRRVGYGKAVRWPTGIGGKGNEGVTGYLKQFPGAIGYIELAYAHQNRLAVAALRNRAGKFVLPTLESVSAAARTRIPPDTRTLIVDTDAPDGYPLSAMTWILVYQEQAYGGRSFERARALVELLWWCVHEAQNYNESLLYARLPENVVRINERLLRSITYKGKPVLPPGKK
ncbi:phosphate ABC transporter substrate-binding protein PstS [Thermosulfurimonas sp. F29]|uniref:phosphate ABC transporter substrate-binding protein PstS n=1 Tax=Thermosulfurimonas sp. F29 TaxID=2867247 RepID=UPI001C83815B|nr:phosphate ABC transporter substrate-binding protein PstS [Thermosulfurimonas sp. F29]MBX6422333.1 phosphate ABC transporter substrate-binding protein PstS [Thermosulfurimonas sp. F29]